jgi:NAD(P)H dehydrogenase (quinone)
LTIAINSPSVKNPFNRKRKTNMYLVTGASGHLGKAVINHLLTTHKIAPNQIIATTRTPDDLKDLAARGIHVRAANFDDVGHLTKAFEGATRLLLISTSAMEPGQRIIQHLNAVKAAENAKVSHITYTSMPNPIGSAILFAPDHAGTEMAIQNAKIPSHTILRNNWYFENLLFSLPQALKSGTQYAATGQGKIAHIARDDLARAAATVLASNSDGKITYTLSGPKEYTTEDIAKLVSAETGKPLAVVQVPVDGLIKGMLGAGLPEGMARMYASFDEAISKGNLSGTDQDFKTLTGAEPQSFETWLKANASAFTA